MKPMRATPVTQDVLRECVHSDQWVISQKIDGRRALVEVLDGKVTAYGRDGQVFKLGNQMDQTFAAAMPNGRWLIDGELARTEGRYYVFFAFDLPVAGNLISPTSPFGERLQALEHLSKLAKWESHGPLGVLHYAKDEQAKASLVIQLKLHNAEGVILRKVSGVYKEAIESREYLKYKFTLDADCVVREVGAEGKHNIVLAVYRDGKLTDVGKCTAMAGDGASIQVNDVVTVRYSHLSDDGRLVHPTYPLIRKDKQPEECGWEQLVPADRRVFREEDLSRPGV